MSPTLSECSCTALRQAARHVSRFYDGCLASSGLRTTQFSILSRLNRHGPLTINALAADLVMDRTTLGRNILPLQRDGLIAIVKSSSDRRQRELHLTPTGAARLRSAASPWAAAQTRFQAAFGPTRTAELRALLDAVVQSDLGSSDAPPSGSDHAASANRAPAAHASARISSTNALRRHA